MTKQRVRCEAHIMRYHGSWPVPGQCVNSARSHIEVVNDRSDLITMHVCGIHERKLLADSGIWRVREVAHNGIRLEFKSERVSLVGQGGGA